MSSISHPDIILAGENLTKSFFGNIVLNDVSISCKKGNVLALVGENGAGKSTLMNILSGSIQPDHGIIKYMGKNIRFKNPQIAKEMGIAFVHQELSLLPELSVGENILLGKEPTGKFGLISHLKLHDQATEVLKELQYDVDVFKQVKELTPAEKQVVEIAKAWATRPKVLILDEPTSSLSKVEVSHLFKMVERLKNEGTSIILITHRMDEIFRISDEAVILKDGNMMKTELVENITREELIRSMVGREITQTFPQRKALGDTAETLLQLKDIQLDGLLTDINLSIPKGHIIGIGGLEGQGQRQLARGLFGVTPFSNGKVIFEDQEITLKSPFEAIAHKIGFIPDDRKLEGLVLPLSVKENLILLDYLNISKKQIVQSKLEAEAVKDGMDQLSVKASSPNQKVQFLSGGNQQKIVFSKWLKMNPKLLILHEPTRGVDIQSKIEIYQLLRDIANQGVSILMFTSDMLELIGLSDHIYVMYEGKINGDISGFDATEEKVMTLSSGQTSI